MLKIENTVSDIKLHPQKISAKKLNAKGEVIVNGIILSKPFKLQITVVSKVNRKRTKRVRSIEYRTTLKAAVADAIVKRSEWREEKKTAAPKKVEAVVEMMTLSEAYKRYTAAQKIKYESHDKGEYDSYRYDKLFEKHIEPVLVIPCLMILMRRHSCLTQPVKKGVILFS